MFVLSDELGFGELSIQPRGPSRNTPPTSPRPEVTSEAEVTPSMTGLQCREHARESDADNLKGITSVVPVLASSRFGPAMIALCEARGVGVVKPNGSGHTYFPSASPPNLSGRRGFHTLARVLRVLF